MGRRSTHRMLGATQHLNMYRREAPTKSNVEEKPHRHPVGLLEPACSSLAHEKQPAGLIRGVREDLDVNNKPTSPSIRAGLQRHANHTRLKLATHVPQHGRQHLRNKLPRPRLIPLQPTETKLDLASHDAADAAQLPSAARTKKDRPQRRDLPQDACPAEEHEAATECARRERGGAPRGKQHTGPTSGHGAKTTSKEAILTRVVRLAEELRLSPDRSVPVTRDKKTMRSTSDGDTDVQTSLMEHHAEAAARILAATSRARLSRRSRRHPRQRRMRTTRNDMSPRRARRKRSEQGPTARCRDGLLPACGLRQARAHHKTPLHAVLRQSAKCKGSHPRPEPCRACRRRTRCKPPHIVKPAEALCPNGGCARG